jgi:hypothetical protein
MTDYCIRELGSSFVIAADGQDVLRCADQNIAHQIVRVAEADRCPANSTSCITFIGLPTVLKGDVRSSV